MQSRGFMYESSSEKFIRLFKPLVDAVRKFKKTGRVLDVGCSSGILLSVLQKEGFDVHGLEPNTQAYSIARTKLGARIHNQNIADFTKNFVKKFDCIIYNHVLEHIENVHKELAFTKRLLNKNGILVIGVPNTHNITFFLRQKYWEPLMPNEHIWHFSSGYLIRLIQSYSFKNVYRYFSDDSRDDYPFFKRLYFRLLSFINTIFCTGESVLLIFQNNKDFPSGY